MKDRIQEHHGQQLSALMDGELAPDQARFLLRRLEHDRELAGSWERWHLAGEVLRGRAVAAMPRDFPARIGTALAAERTAVANGARAPAWLRWGGGAALAASLAVVALLAGRPASMTGSADKPMAAAAVEADAGRAVGPAPAAVASPAAPVAVAAVEPERPPAAARRAVSGAERDRIARPQRPTAVAVASSEAPPAAQDPFSGDIVTRPWPRAVLPQFGGGVLATGAGAAASPAQPVPSFYPFDPRRVPETGTGTQQAGGEPAPGQVEQGVEPTRAP